jgi:hypothetical protein
MNMELTLTPLAMCCTPMCAMMVPVLLHSSSLELPAHQKANSQLMMLVQTPCRSLPVSLTAILAQQQHSQLLVHHRQPRAHSNTIE